MSKKRRQRAQQQAKRLEAKRDRAKRRKLRKTKRREQQLRWQQAHGRWLARIETETDPRIVAAREALQEEIDREILNDLNQGDFDLEAYITERAERLWEQEQEFYYRSYDRSSTTEHNWRSEGF